MYPSLKSHKVGTGGPHPWSGDPKDLERLAKMIADARQKVGPDGSVMFDAHSSVPPPMLIQLAGMIQPYDVLWIEEPAVPGNIEVFKRLKEAIHIPFATGERDRTIWGMIPYLQERCIDILQPDVGQTGGISQVKKIATLAEAYNVPIAPHSTCTELGLTASLHVTAAVPNFLIHEGYPNIGAPGVARKTWELDKDGYASLPEGPGLGVEVDEQRIAEVAADPKRKFKWPHPVAPDGSVIDY
jgi:galactonate dehydratase